MQGHLVALTLGLFVSTALTSVATAQETTGVPGAPSATTTIDGHYLPNPPPAFGGEIGLDAKDSKPYWPPQIVPPKGAPNVLLIMTDDAGYGVSGTFGGVIPTPAHGPHRADGAALHAVPFHRALLADAGGADHRPQPSLRRLRRHFRAGHRLSRLRLHHRRRQRHDRRNPEAERLRHVVVRQEPQHARLSSTAPPAPSTNGPSAWASNISTASWAARPTSGRRILFRNTTQIFPWVGKPGYNLITDMADDAIDISKQLNAAAPDKPFFLYYVPGGTHAPHQPTPGWIDKFKGKFDMGWNAMRDADLRQPEAARRDPGEHDSSRPGRTASPMATAEMGHARADEKKLFARQAEVFAAYVAYTDHEIGRVIQAVDDMGKLDNTLIIYIEGDNGTSAEGSTLGTPFDLAAIQGIDVPVAEQLKFYDVWGSDKTTRTCRWRGPGRSIRRSNGPSRSPRISAAPGRAWPWPGRPASRTPAASARQFHHMIDIVPTILEATGIPAPVMVNGVAQKPIEGVSMAYTWDKANADAPSTRTTQYFEMFGNRAHLPRRLVSPARRRRQPPG